MIYAIDFDGIIYSDGKINDDVVNRIKEVKENGDEVVLYTSRLGKALEEAKELVEGIEFDDIKGGKFYADAYIDDRNMSLREFVGNSERSKTMKNETREMHLYDCEMRSEQNEEHGTFITGKPIVFNADTNLGYYTERIDPHALDNTDLKDVRFLVNHNTDMIPLARSRNNNANSTMQMSVAEDGMDIRVNLDIEGNTEAKNLYSAVKRGDVTGMSFMFTVDGENWEGLDTEMPTRTITSIGKVFEVSAVTFPAYEQTSIEAASRDEALERAKSALESAQAEERRQKMIAEIKSMM